MRDPTDIPITVLVVAEDQTEVVVARIDAGTPDLALVDALMRIRLAFRRRGWRMRLCGVPDELRGLLELVGLADVSGLEPGREPELGEQLGVDEVMQRRDPLL